MSNTFSKEVTFLSKVFNETNSQWEEKPVTKTATFVELSRTNRKQHKLHFSIVTLFSSSISGEGDDKKVFLDSDQIYDIAVRAIKDLTVVSIEFTETDKNEVLNDSGALFDFGYWLVSEKLIPFFLILTQK